jgi:hypothetical protein
MEVVLRDSAFLDKKDKKPNYTIAQQRMEVNTYHVMKSLGNRSFRLPHIKLNNKKLLKLLQKVYCMD